MLKIFDIPSLVYSGMYDLILLHEAWIIIGVGFIIGVIASLLGIGCGLLIVPFFVIVIECDMHQAITLSLTTMFFLSLTATLVHKKLHALDTIPIRNMIMPAFAGAMLGAFISHYAPAEILKKVFGAFLLITACHFILRYCISVYIRERATTVCESAQ